VLAERQAEMLAHRIAKVAPRLRAWAAQQEVDAYRVYDRDIPEIPLCCDVYGDTLHVAEVVDLRREAPGGRLARLASAAAGVLEIAPGAVFTKERRRQAGGSQYERLSEESVTRVVTERGLRFEVNLTDYLDTGLFLDHRVTRAKVRGMSSGLRVLNLFCYTGSFTVVAAAGGARSTTSVDLSRTYLDWAKKNLALNGLAGPQHELVRADALALVRDSRQTWDLIVCDPPTWSRSKGMQGTFDVQRDHGPLLEALCERLAPGGRILFSTNRRGFRLEAEALPWARIEELTPGTIPRDFRDREVHRAFWIERGRLR
jgi:23S rRNA G2069 N7-methylase RlmK/C1962 C5-methylase RlmI